MKYPDTPSVGDKIICIDDDSEDLDIGASGLVSKGRSDLVVGYEYEISELPYDADKYIPKNECRFGGELWTEEEYRKVRWGWFRVYLKGISSSVFLHNFKPKV